jgi:CHAD domain-containing protein
MAEAYADPSAGAFHEWRKRVKYHRYHVRLLRDLWRPLLDCRRAALHELSDLLGEAHDLGLLRNFVVDDPDLTRDSRTVESFLGLVEQRRAEAHALARPIGLRLYAERPGRFGARLARYWSVFRVWGGVERLVAADAGKQPGRKRC